MQRTPQPLLTQTKLTGYGVTQGASTAGSASPLGAGRAGPTAAPLSTDPNAVTADPAMDTTTSTQAGGAFITTDFLLRALKENTDHIVGSFNAHMGAISKRVDLNAAGVAANREASKENAASISRNKGDLENLRERVDALERGTAPSSSKPNRASLSPDYLLARRSIRLWPIAGVSDREMWEAVGDFLHDTLLINTEDLCQEDVESVARVMDGVGSGIVKDEVIVRFKEVSKRDLTVGYAVNLSGRVDSSGRPTAGIRLEVPPELSDTFRLLSRFGTRLRARHGEGTKRHVKFDDFAGSLFTNIKLPGDTSWTRVSPEMARRDLDASISEESAANQKRLASKLIPGPRERLRRPAEESRPVRSSGTVGHLPGKRPRWSVPPRERT